jgi:hypothetical protein
MSAVHEHQVHACRPRCQRYVTDGHHIPTRKVRSNEASGKRLVDAHLQQISFASKSSKQDRSLSLSQNRPHSLKTRPAESSYACVHADVSWHMRACARACGCTCMRGAYSLPSLNFLSRCFTHPLHHLPNTPQHKQTTST